MTFLLYDEMVVLSLHCRNIQKDIQSVTQGNWKKKHASSPDSSSLDSSALSMAALSLSRIMEMEME